MKTYKNQDIKYIYIYLIMIIFLLLICILLLVTYISNDNVDHACNCSINYYINNDNANTKSLFNNVSKFLPYTKFDNNMYCIEQTIHNKYNDSVILNEIKNLQLKKAINSNNNDKIIHLETQINNNKIAYLNLIKDIDGIIGELNSKNIKSS